MSSVKTKKRSRLNRINRWLEKNSIIYRSTKRLLKKKVGRILASFILLIGIFYILFSMFNRFYIKDIVKNWEAAINLKNKKEVVRYLDYSKDNEYRATFPDFESIFNQNISFKFDILNVDIANFFSWAEIDVMVNTFKNNQSIGNFKGRILMRKEKISFLSWKIVGLESY